MRPFLSRKSLAGGLVGAVLFTWAVVNAQTAGTISASQTSDAPKPSPTKRQSGNIPVALFWLSVSVLIVLIIGSAAFLAFIQRKKRVRQAAADRNAVRARQLSQGQEGAPGENIRLTHLTPRDHPAQNDAGWMPGPNDGSQLPTRPPHGFYPQDAAAFVTSHPQHGQQAQEAGSSEAAPQPSGAVPQIVEPRPESPDRNRVLEDKTRRAHLRQLASLREAKLKNAALQTQTVRTVEEEFPEAGPSGQRDPYALDDTVSRSDDSRFDIIPRGPTVDPAYQAAREQRYRKLIAAGYSHSRAMSVSEASTGESEGPGPLSIVAPAPCRAPTSHPGSHLIPPAPPSLSGRRAIHLPRINVPDRWQPRPMAEAVAGRANVSDGFENSAILRHPVPPGEDGHRRDPWRLSQVDVGLTETDDTATRTSTVISDDPWREEVLENRRRYGNR
ncbi:MAG: hypothetical protein M1815_005698 [Lichina confinis]|nr:MAG: hypothetical protein M1815_005698 [Lichina confinis]